MLNIPLKTARRIARLTQRQLADQVGVDPSTISLIETGQRSIASMSYESVVLLAKALNIEPHELVSDGDAQQTAPSPITKATQA